MEKCMECLEALWCFLPWHPRPDKAHLHQWKWDKDVLIKNATRRAFPHARFTDFCSQDDKTQKQYFLAGGGNGSNWTTYMRDLLADSGSPQQYHYYIKGGSTHCQAIYDDFYTVQVGGVKLSTYMKALVEDEPMPSGKGRTDGNVDCSTSDAGCSGPVGQRSGGRWAGL